MTRELLPFEAYDEQVAYASPRWRVALSVGLVYAFILLLVDLAVPPLRNAGEPLPRLLVRVGGTGALFGVFWAGFGPWWQRRQLRKLVTGDPDEVPAAPAGNFPVRITANLIEPGYRVIGGHLYAGPGDWVFVPQRRTPQREREPRRIERGTVRSVRPASDRLPPISRLFTRGPRPVVIVETTEGTMRFSVPRPGEVAATLGAWVPPAHH